MRDSYLFVTLTADEEEHPSEAVDGVGGTDEEEEDDGAMLVLLFLNDCFIGNFTVAKPESMKQNAKM